MYNFYPGPSKLYPAIKTYALEAFESRILERNHRSEVFMDMMKQSIFNLKKHLNIPEEYSVFFTSSATESWEICTQSFLGEFPVSFYYNGAFGKKWALYTKRILGEVQEYSLDLEEKLAISPEPNADICIVANETSNGTHIDLESIAKPAGDGLLALDVVSSLGGVDYDISQGDIWIASSQKCLGLPSGLGIMIVSPKAMQRARAKNEYNHYNSAIFLEENFGKFQTPYTPNILAIFMLKRHMETLDNVNQIAQRIDERAKKIYSFFDKQEIFQPLIKKDEGRSSTVIAVKTDNFNKLNQYLSDKNIIIGKGYGEWKSVTFRIANFPAIKDYEYDHLFEIISNFAKNYTS